ncbi:MAG: rhomboid protease GluP [Bradymonadia bacterium]|jgi:rhomboid protease GluP
MSLCSQMVADGFAPGCPEELDELAGDADMVMTFSDGKTLEARFIFDATTSSRVIPYSKEELLREGAKASEYVGQSWGVVPAVRLAIWWIGEESTEADLRSTELLPTGWRGEGGVHVSVWHLSANGNVRSSAPLQGLWDDRRTIEVWLRAGADGRPNYEPATPATRRRCWPFLLLLMVAMFVFQQVVHEGPRNGLLGLNAPLARALGGADATLFGEWFRLVTASFVHENLSHLVGNLIGLALCGNICERFVGRANTAAVFLLGGAAGAVFSSAFSSPEVVSVGASGGIAALWTLGVASTLHRPHRKARSVATGQLRLVGIFAMLATLTGGAATALAHAGGVLVGVAWYAFTGRKWTPRSQPTYARLSALVITGAALLGVWGVDELRGRFQEETLGLASLEFLMSEGDVDRLRSASLATASEAATAFPSDPRVQYVHAHKLLDAGDPSASLAATAQALNALETTQQLFPSGALEGSIRQLRILAAEAGSVPDVIGVESRLLCGRLFASDAGMWASDLGLCD